MGKRCKFISYLFWTFRMDEDIIQHPDTHLLRPSNESALYMNF